MKLRYTSAALGLSALAFIGLIPVAHPGHAAKSAQPGISADASAAIRQMSKTLSANEFSFQVQTIRVYEDEDGQPLHIFHTMKVVAHRPDHLAVHRTGDDGATDLFYDGKTVALLESPRTSTRVLMRRIILVRCWTRSVIASTLTFHSRTSSTSIQEKCSCPA